MYTNTMYEKCLYTSPECLVKSSLLVCQLANLYGYWQPNYLSQNILVCYQISNIIVSYYKLFKTF